MKRQGWAWIATLGICCVCPLWVWFDKPDAWDDLSSVKPGMTVDQTLIAYPHAAAVIPDRTEMLGYREYLQRHGVKPKQFKGTLVDRGSDSLLVVADGVIYSGRGTWPRGTPKEGKSAEAFMKLGGHWLASSDDQRDLDVRLYFQAYPEKRATFSGQWVFHAFPVFRVDLWSLQMNIRFQNGKVVRTSRREISD